MEEIKNYKLSEFLKKDLETAQQYLTVLALIPSVPTKNEVFYLKLRQVQDIKELMQEGTLDDLIQIIMITEEIEQKIVLGMKILDFFALVNSVREQLEQIYRAEHNSLASNQPNFKWEAVGGSEKISKFGIYNTLDKLSNGDITKYEQVLDLSYADCFTKLYMDTVKGDIEYEMSQMKTQ